MSINYPSNYFQVILILKSEVQVIPYPYMLHIHRVRQDQLLSVATFIRCRRFSSCRSRWLGGCRRWLSRRWLSRRWLSRRWLSRRWLSRRWLSRRWLSRRRLSRRGLSRRWLSRRWLSRRWLSRRRLSRRRLSRRRLSRRRLCGGNNGRYGRYPDIESSSPSTPTIRSGYHSKQCHSNNRTSQLCHLESKTKSKL